jgi:hypothetical protein
MNHVGCDISQAARHQLDLHVVSTMPRHVCRCQVGSEVKGLKTSLKREIEVFFADIIPHYSRECFAHVQIQRKTMNGWPGRRRTVINIGSIDRSARRSMGEVWTEEQHNPSEDAHVGTAVLTVVFGENENVVLAFLQSIITILRMALQNKKINVDESMTCMSILVGFHGQYYIPILTPLQSEVT